MNMPEEHGFVRDNFSCEPSRQIVRFKYLSDIPLTSGDAWELQKNQSSYHPSGYGFYDFQCNEIKPGEYISSWNSLIYCD